MKIPNLVNEQFVDKEGHLTDTWRMILTQLFTQLQINASDEGLVMPSQKTSDIADLDLDKHGAMVYDKNTNQAKVNINGTFKVISTT
jgi:hypothetical protein